MNTVSVADRHTLLISAVHQLEAQGWRLYSVDYNPVKATMWVPAHGGPNHILHGLLSLFTWPLLGGWLWVWLIVALTVKRVPEQRRVVMVSEEGLVSYL